MKTKENVFVITGGPSAGKTTLLNALRKKGMKCFDEVSRAVIEEQLKTKGKLLPWIDLAAFNKKVVSEMKKQHATVSEGIHFFDRGFPDNVGYCKLGNAPVIEEVSSASKEFRYNKKVFFLAPWKEIYVNDEVRREPFEYALKIAEHIKNAYVEFDYEVIVVPNAPVEQRVNFILEHVGDKKKKKE